MYWLRLLRRFLGSVPLIGPLGSARLSDHREALTEVSIAIALATMPIWLGSLLMTALASQNLSFWDNVVQNVRDGEILLFCSTLTGPLFYFVFVQNRQMPSFPAARSLMLSATGILLVSAAFFAFQRGDGLFGEDQNIDDDVIFVWSIYAFAFAAAISYLATCYRHLREGGAAAYQKTQTADFVHEFNERSGGVEDDTE